MRWVGRATPQMTSRLDGAVVGPGVECPRIVAGCEWVHTV